MNSLGENNISESLMDPYKPVTVFSNNSLRSLSLGRTVQWFIFTAAVYSSMTARNNKHIFVFNFQTVKTEV